MSAVRIPAYDNVAGNAYDKYHSVNPVARRLMQGFLGAFDELVEQANPKRVFEIGCGEGHLSSRLLARGIEVHGCDVDADIVCLANDLVQTIGKGQCFKAQSIYDISPGEIEADLIVCCEVLEHLPDPERALDILAAQNARYWLFSVPREPVWRVLNLARGKYVAAGGNTPGHIQHWSATAFKKVVAEKFEIARARQPLPWTMVLCTRQD